MTEAARTAPLDVTVSGTTATPPPEISTEISRCVGEALRNVARHAGTGRADVSAREAGDVLVVEVSDEGQGFDPRLVAASRRGISESIRARMEADRRGGRGHQRTGCGHPGRLAVAEMTSVQPSAILATRYSRALDIAIVVVVVGWDLSGERGELLANLDRYRIARGPGRRVAGAGGGGCGRFSPAAARAGRARSGWALAALALLVSTVVAAGCPRAHMLAADWGWVIAGWIAVLVLLRRPLTELVVFLGLEALATFAVLLRDGLDRQSLAAFVTVLSASVVIQLAAALAARAVAIPARQAADLAASDARGPGAAGHQRPRARRAASALDGRA